MTVRGKPTLCVDFDGVIHSYESGWQGGEIYGHVVPGFFEWVVSVQDHFIVAVYSSRSKDEQTRMEMTAWLNRQINNWYEDNSGAKQVHLTIATEKPAAWLTIDDRCIRFDGNWKSPELWVEQLIAYKPWTDLPR
jgi:hypothetical protein